jgi:uncharacterized membrane protein YraQ (UPF0718 family)
LQKSIDGYQYIWSEVTMNEVIAIAAFVVEAVIKVWPAFLISVALGLLIRALKLDGVIRSAFNARIGWAVALATAVGAFSPFCSCSVIPVVSGLLMSGVPLAPVMSFWLASPTMDPEIFSLSVATLGWPLAVARLVATLIVSAGAGYITILLMRGGLLPTSVLKAKAADGAAPARQASAPAAAAQTERAPQIIPIASLATVGGSGFSAGAAVMSPPPSGFWGSTLERFREIDWRDAGKQLLQQTWDLGRWLLVAFVLEALIIRYVPQEAIAGVLGKGSLMAVPLAALVGIPLYLNNISALPIVSGLMAQGMQPGAAIAFLIAGPITTIPAMTAVWGIVRKRVFFLYLGLGLVGSIVMGYATNLVMLAR